MTDEVQKIVNALRAECFYASDNDDGKNCNDCPRIFYCHDKDADIERDAADLIERMDAEIEKLRRERDAAVYDLAINRSCATCMHEIGFKCAAHGCAHANEWQWRGVCEENSKEDGE